MTNFSFVPSKPHLPDKTCPEPAEGFALLRVPRAGQDFARKALSWITHPPRASLPS